MSKCEKYKGLLIAVLAIIVTVIMLVPIIQVGLHNYATGDDYKFSIYTYQGLVNGGIIGALQGSCKMVAHIYETWQGTWFTIFLFSLAPQNWGEGLYAITVFISLGALLWAEYIIISRYLLSVYGFKHFTVIAIVFMIFNISVQYIPRTTSGIFWFNGVMHYTIPLLIAFGCISSTRVVLNGKEGENEKKYYFRKIALILGLTALGGSNYLAAIIGLFGVSYEVVIYIIDQCKNHRFKFMTLITSLIAIIFEFVGLYISYKSPGNDIRSFDDMSFRPKYFVKCIWWAIDRSRTDLIKYFKDTPILFLYLLFLIVLVGLEVVDLYRAKTDRKDSLIKHPYIALLFVNGTHMASYMPEVYAHSDVSGGVPNTHFQLLLLVILVDVVIVAELILKVIKKRIHKERLAGIFKPILVVSSIAAIMVMGGDMCFGDNLTTKKTCENYINSGRMNEYEKVRIQQYKMCISEVNKEVVMPEYYEDVYPLCHMALSADKSSWFNEEMASYYGLKSIVVYDFNEE